MNSVRQHMGRLMSVLSLAVALMGSAHAQQVYVLSDAYQNTFVGSDALNHLAGGVANTASGYFTLIDDTTGNSNTGTDLRRVGSLPYPSENSKESGRSVTSSPRTQS
jgi:hypothetical protein